MSIKSILLQGATPQVRKRLRRIKYKLLSPYYNWCKRYDKRAYADYRFKRRFGHTIDWEHPRDLNEVINVLSLTTDTSEWTRLADKYRVREFIHERGCEDILVPLLGMWERTEDVDWDALPDQFVMKCNNGYGDVIIVKDKQSADKKDILRRLNKSLHSKFGLDTCEPHYLRIPPCIIAEKFLDGGTNGLIDYKIWCLNGEPYCILVCSERDPQTHHCKLNLYDLEWNNMGQYLQGKYKNSEEIARPKTLGDMINYARTLSAGFPEVRMDFYEAEGKTYIGEMTFTAACGRMKDYTPEILTRMGQMVDLHAVTTSCAR